MNLKEFAQMLDGKEYGYPQFTKEEISIAKENGFVIVSGASDDLVEFEGVIYDEGDCYSGGEVYVHAVNNGKIIDLEDENINEIKNNPEYFKLSIHWCCEKDSAGEIIPWTYEVPILHESFMIYEDGIPYCRGIVFSINNSMTK